MNGAMTRDSSLLALALLVALLASCGGSKPFGVFAGKKGMTKQQVQKFAGSPDLRGPNSWLYHTSRNGSSIDGMRFCFTSGKVSLIQTAVHG
jgi:hypothetical protein